MPLVTLIFSFMLAFICFGMILNAIDENPFYWLPALVFGFWAVMEFMKFLAMC